MSEKRDIKKEFFIPWCAGYLWHGSPGEIIPIEPLEKELRKEFEKYWKIAMGQFINDWNEINPDELIFDGEFMEEI